MSRTDSPRSVWTTTTRRPENAWPISTDRSSSSEESGSRIVLESGSPKAVAASSKETPCFSRLRAAFSRSHSKFISPRHHVVRHNGPVLQLRDPASESTPRQLSATLRRYLAGVERQAESGRLQAPVRQPGLDDQQASPVVDALGLSSPDAPEFGVSVGSENLLAVETRALDSDLRHPEARRNGDDRRVTPAGIVRGVLEKPATNTPLIGVTEGRPAGESDGSQGNKRQDGNQDLLNHPEVLPAAQPQIRMRTQQASKPFVMRTGFS